MTCAEIIFHKGNPNVLQWAGVKDYSVSPATAVTTATVVVTLLDASGEEVSGQAWPATMAHTAGGTYQAILEYDIAIIARKKYTAHIVATMSGNVVADIMAPISVETRTQ